MVSAADGSLTMTCWNRRSNAASFSMYWRYSLRVVAAMMRILPRAMAGLRRLAASMPPPDEPWPAMRRWTSSMKRMTPDSAFSHSSMTDLMRSSYWPL